MLPQWRGCFMNDERKCEHGYGINQGPCPTCDCPPFPVPLWLERERKQWQGTYSLLPRLAKAFQDLNNEVYAPEVLAAMYRDGTDGYGRELHVADEDVEGIFRGALEAVADVLKSEVWIELLDAVKDERGQE